MKSHLTHYTLCLCLAGIACTEPSEPPAACETPVAYYLDADGDTFGAGDAAKFCPSAEPAKYVSRNGDCAPRDPNSWRWVERFDDQDGDGFGSEVLRRCVGTIVPSHLTQLGGDCAPLDAQRWRAFAYKSKDEDGDGKFINYESVLCAGAEDPAGYASTPVSGPQDCNDNDPTRFNYRELYRDADRDGVGAGPLVPMCLGHNLVPQGYSARNGDCAPNNIQFFRERPYAHRDADGDGATVPEVGQACSGGFGLAPGYYAQPQDPDCDDTQADRSTLLAGFLDQDADGFGAGPQLELCLPSLAPDYATNGTDCDDQDALAWLQVDFTHRDADRDGYTIPEVGSVCIGVAQLPEYLTQASPEPDCDDSSPVLHWGFDGYLDTDGDGVGAGAPTALCTDGSVPGLYVTSGDDCAPNTPAQFAALRYSAVDRDGDGATVAEAGLACTGGTLAAPYFVVDSGQDCDDADPSVFELTLLFDDLDRDGVGAGPARKECLGTLLAVGTSPYGDDPDDADPTVQVDEELIDLLLLEL